MRCQRKGLDRVVSTFAGNARSNFLRRDLRAAAKRRDAPQYVLLTPALDASQRSGVVFDELARVLGETEGHESENSVAGQDRLCAEDKLGTRTATRPFRQH